MKTRFALIFLLMFGISYAQTILQSTSTERCLFSESKTFLKDCETFEENVYFTFDKDFSSVSYFYLYDYTLLLTQKDNTPNYISYEAVEYGDVEEYKLTLILDKISKQLKILFDINGNDYIVKFSIINWNI